MKVYFDRRQPWSDRPPNITFVPQSDKDQKILGDMFLFVERGFEPGMVVGYGMDATEDKFLHLTVELKEPEDEPRISD